MGSRRMLVLLVLVLPALGGCSLLSPSDAEVTKACEDGFWREAKERTGYTPSADGRAKVHHVCAALIEAGVRDPDDKEALMQFISEHPDLGVEVCEATAPVLYPLIPSEHRRYITMEDVTRLSAEGCRYTIAHGQSDGQFALAQLFKAQPDLVSPFCVAQTMVFYDRLPAAERKALPRSAYRKLWERVCLKAIRAGVVDFSDGNYTNPRVDQQRLNALYTKTVAQMQASGELPAR